MKLGQDVFFSPASTDPQPYGPGPLVAKVVHVHDDGLVNLTVFDQDGHAYGARGVPVGDPGNGECFCLEGLPEAQPEFQGTLPGDAAPAKASNKKVV